MSSYSIELYVLLLFSITWNFYIYGQNPPDMMEAFPDVQYRSYSAHSLINQSTIATKLQCAAQCLQTEFCRTATFIQPNRTCLLYTEFIELGQLIQADKTFTFRRQVSYTCSNMTYINGTDYLYNDITSINPTNSTACFRACILTANCVGAAFKTYNGVPGTCWLKSTIAYNQLRNNSDVTFALC